jgi:hypothetical protein
LLRLSFLTERHPGGDVPTRRRRCERSVHISLEQTRLGSQGRARDPALRKKNATANHSRLPLRVGRALAVSPRLLV